ncbi:MAG: ribosomal L7Ae/L30e/S12e/Gadd45 family protein [Nanoarchaeota archaeon]|nr:ribosomal L7Ae/L30e/S12e/Gadd45 family protein [Nanoarchaeota archaeon]
MSLEKLKKALKEEKLIFGIKETIKNIKNGNAKTVFLASNCSDSIKEQIRHYAKLGDFEIMELGVPDSEIGMLCKKLHSISVLSF